MEKMYVSLGEMYILQKYCKPLDRVQHISKKSVKNNQITINPKIKNKINVILKLSPSYLFF